MTTHTDAQEQNRVQRAFEKPYQNYLKTLETIQKDWIEELNKRLADFKRNQLETALAHSGWSYNQLLLPSTTAVTAQHLTASAWEAIRGTARATEAYATFLTQIKQALTEVRPDELTPQILDGTANCMKIVAAYAHQIQAGVLGLATQAHPGALAHTLAQAHTGQSNDERKPQPKA